MAKKGKQYTKIAGTWEQIKPSYNDLTDVPLSFNPSSHEHTASDIDSETATSGYVLTADGSGNSSWQEGVSKSDLQNVYIYGKASVAITKGQAVQFAGAQGDHILIKPAVPSEINSNPDYMIGIAETSLAVNDFGYIIVNGRLTGAVTNLFTAGSILYFDSAAADTSPGVLTTTEPTEPKAIIQMGAVSVSGNGNGEIVVRTTLLTRNIHEINGLQAILDSIQSDTNTTYSISAVDSSNDVIIRLSGSDATTDDIKLVAGSNITLTPSGDNITISATDTNTTYTLGSFGITATAAELNKMDGVTATTTELNYVDGVTSAIQTQLDAKAALASPALTGTPTAPTANSGTNTTQIATTAFVQNALTGVTGGLNFAGSISLSGGKNGDQIAAAGLNSPGDYLIVTTAGDLVAGGTLVTLAVQAPGDEGDSTLPVTLEVGDWIVYVSGDGSTMTVAIINNTDTRFAPTTHTHTIANVTNLQTSLDAKVAKAGDTMTGDLRLNGGGTARAVIKLVSSANQPNDLYFGANNVEHWSLTSREAANPFLGLYNTSGSPGWAWQISNSTNKMDFTTTPSVNGTNVSLDGHTHDDRYYTESEADSRFINASGDSMASGAALSLNRIGSLGTEIRIGAGESLGSITGSSEAVYLAGESGVYVYASTDNLSSGLNKNTTLIDSSGNMSINTGNLTVSGSVNTSQLNLSGQPLQVSGSNLLYDGDAIWHEGNFNPSSYLTTSGKAADANLLDGIDSGSFVRSDTADTVVGNHEFYGTDTGGNYYNAPIEIREVNLVTTNQSSSAYAPAIAWHWGGRAQVSMRLLSNGKLTLDGNQTGQILTTTEGTAVDSDKLDGYDWLQSGKSIRATEFYADNWFRNYNAGEGLYNEATGGYFYSNSVSEFILRSNSTSVNMRLQTSGGATQGYIYADTGANTGWLNNGGGWKWQIDNNGQLNIGTVPWARLSGVPSTFTPSSHTHDDRYYTESESDSRFLNASGDVATGQIAFRTSGIGLERNYANNGIWFNSGSDTNHILWNDYYGGPTTRGAAGSGFDGMKWNTYRGIHIRGGSAGGTNIIVAENSSGATADHRVKLYASGAEKLSTNTWGVAVTGDLEINGEAAWHGGNLSFSLSGTTLSITTS